jgi:hypothetical protein
VLGLRLSPISGLCRKEGISDYLEHLGHVVGSYSQFLTPTSIRSASMATTRLACKAFPGPETPGAPPGVVHLYI